MPRFAPGMAPEVCPQGLKKRNRRAAVLLFATLACAASVLAPRRETKTDGPHAAGLGSAETLDAAFESWLGSYTGYGGGEDVLVLGLNYVKGLSSRHTRAAGVLRLNLAEGSLEATVRGLPEDATYELWLVDNVAGKGRGEGGGGVRAEPGHDDLRLVGPLVSAGDEARITASLDVAALSDFDLDLVAVAPAGSDVGREGLIFGLPSLFQRIYHEERSAGFGPRDDRRGTDEPGEALATLLPFLAAAAPAVPRSLIGDGEFFFFEETFDGNGRTCGTCHPAENNFTLDPEFIAALPDDDPLFVAEFVPALAGLENPTLMRELAVILENVDGFDRPGVMRGVPHTLSMANSLNPAVGGFDGSTVPPLQRTGWSGDGSPGGGTLREFAIGAVVQHLPKTLARVDTVDFRMPTEYELDALEAFQLSLGRLNDPDLSGITMVGPIAEMGRQLFLQETTNGGANSAGKCTSCHHNGGANASPQLLASNGFPAGQFNLNLNIGTSELNGALAEFIDPGNVPVDGGFGQDENTKLGGFGSHAFNVPTLLEAPDTAPYFHDNSTMTLEGAIAFYLGGEFNGSPGADMLAMFDDPPGFGVMELTIPDVQAIAAFLRVANAVLNVRSAKAYMTRLQTAAVQSDATTRDRLYKAALKDLADAQFVMSCAHLHPDAVARLSRAHSALKTSNGTNFAEINNAIAYANGVPPMLMQ